MTRVWKPLLVALGGLASACTDGDRPRHVAVPPGAEMPAPPLTTDTVPAPRALTRLPLGQSADALCASLEEEDLNEANYLARNRLGLLQSAARVEATIGEFVPARVGAPFVVATVHVDRVWFGPWFIEGVDTSVVLPETELEGFEPGSYVLGMSEPFPPRNSSAGSGVWHDVKALIPSERRADFESLLTYAVPSSAVAAVVEITSVDQEAQRAYLHTLEPLAGEPPKHFTASWDARNQALAFPFAGPAPYVMTFSAASDVQQGHFSDFRPWDTIGREVVNQGLVAPLPVADARDLADWVESYRTAWAFHVAPHVLATRVSGLGYIPDDIAYVSHEVTTDFKSSVGVSQLLFEDHSGPRCGDSFLTALGDEQALTPAPPEFDAACEKPIALPESEFDLATADINVRVQLPDTELGRTQVAEWLQAPDPVYLLSDAPAPRAAAALARDAFWSQIPSLEQTLAVAQLQPLTVQSVTRQGELTEVTLQLSSGSEAPGPLRRLSARCIDPRLLREGSSWLAPVVANQTASFIVPGWLFPTASAR